MRSGNGDAGFKAHQLGQHQGAGHDGDFLRPRGHHFRIVSAHRRRGDDDLRPGNVLCGVANKGGNAQGLQVLQGGTVGQVRPRDGVAQVVQHFGNAAHARAANADEVNVLNGVFHRASSWQAATTAAVASVFCIILAFCAVSSSVERCIF